MTEDEAAELAARIERDLLAEPGVSTVYPASGALRLRDAAAKLVGAEGNPARILVRTGEVLQVEVALGVDSARPAPATARAAQRLIRAAAAVPVQIRLTISHLEVAPSE